MLASDKSFYISVYVCAVSDQSFTISETSLIRGTQDTGYRNPKSEQLYNPRSYEYLGGRVLLRGKKRITENRALIHFN